jgi:8-oxo-dGTP diphosphatase
MVTRKQAGKKVGDEKAFLASYRVSDFDRPSVAVDVVLLTVDAGSMRVLLLRRDEHPFRGSWALPGGFVGMSESLDEAAARVLRQKALLGGVYLEQLYTFGAVDRDPRTRVVSVVYYALVEPDRLRGVTDAEDAARCLARLEVAWEREAGGDASAVGTGGDGLSSGESELPLAFDHASILGMVVKRLRGKLDYAPIGFELLPAEFTLRRLQSVHETILGRPLNKDAFRRRMLATGMLTPTGKREDEVGHRPAELYRFVTKAAL